MAARPALTWITVIGMSVGAATAQEPPPVFTREEVRIVEGDGPPLATPVPFDLVAPRAEDITVKWSASTGSRSPIATPTVDYVSYGGTATIPAGTTRGVAEILLYGDGDIEPNEHLEIYLEEIDGVPIADTYEYVPVVIVDDDIADELPLTARDDRVETSPNTPLEIVPAANDSFALDAMDGTARLELVTTPGYGVAALVAPGAGEGAQATRIAYAPATDFHGIDTLRYRLCDDAGECREADVRVMVRPRIDAVLTSSGRGGRAFVTLADLPALPSATYTAGSLAPMRVIEEYLLIDPTPADPWDGDTGRRWQVFEPTGSAWEEGTQALFARARALAASSAVDLYVGVDHDADNQPEPDEVLCVDYGGVGTPTTCEATYDLDANLPRNWWVMLHNRRSVAGPVAIETGAVDLGVDDDTFAVTGPGHVPRAADVPLIVSWHDPRMLPGDRHLAYLRIGTGGGVDLPATPVRVERTGSTDDAWPLRGTQWFTPPLRLGNQAHRGLFVDVPAGATSLRFVVPRLSASWYVARGDAMDPASTQVPPAPSSEYAVASGDSFDGVEVTIRAPQLQPGRWYFVPQQHGPVAIPIVVHTEIEGVAPVLRPGSYFNPARSGSGLFLYPAADQWTGLWYTYFEDGSPTWYYLQAEAPGPDGIWTSRVHRTAWNGSAQTVTDVGVAIATPTGPDRFMLTYSIDGRTGSQPFEALGRGCPVRDGDLQDYSSTWFNPARSGTGYSVQTWPDYEYFATFVYDDLGLPRFLAAERAGASTATAVLDLQQLRGSCPTCTFTGLPQRFDVGTLLRRLSNDTLASVGVDAVFTDAVGGTWSVDEPVQPLGGADTTQGCQP